MQLTTLRTPARTTTDLIAYAEHRGLTVRWILHLPQNGRYVPARRTILLREGMSQRRTHSTLAHEIAHDYWRDQRSTDEAEARAWRCASLMLIHPDDYAHAEQLDPSPGGLARELTVTIEVVAAFRQLLSTGVDTIERALRDAA